MFVNYFLLSIVPLMGKDVKCSHKPIILRIFAEINEMALSLKLSFV